MMDETIIDASKVVPLELRFAETKMVTWRCAKGHEFKFTGEQWYLLGFFDHANQAVLINSCPACFKEFLAENIPPLTPVAETL